MFLIFPPQDTGACILLMSSWTVVFSSKIILLQRDQINGRELDFGFLLFCSGITLYGDLHIFVLFFLFIIFFSIQQQGDSPPPPPIIFFLLAINFVSRHVAIFGFSDKWDIYE